MNQLNVLKTENNQREKPFDVYLPPLLQLQKNKNSDDINDKIISHIKNLKINYHFFKHSLSITNSINDASLGHKDKNNLNKIILSNLDDEQKINNFAKKSKSINIKKAQINIYLYKLLFFN